MIQQQIEYNVQIKEACLLLGHLPGIRKDQHRKITCFHKYGVSGHARSSFNQYVQSKGIMEIILINMWLSISE